MRLLILGLLVAVAHTYAPAANSNEPGYTIQGLEDTTGKPTESQLMNVNTQGQPCQCVPYYFCDDYLIADADNKSVTEYIFSEDVPPACSESQEVCCTVVKDIKVKPNKPSSDPKKIKGCGYRNPEGIGAQFNGSTTQFGEYPWVVALLDAENGSYVGVGTLRHPQVVLTAAHVASKYIPDGLKIRAGEWDTQTTKEIYNYQERAVENIYIHQETLYRVYHSSLDFNDKSLWYNIALLRLERPVDLAEHINIICMPEQDEVFDSHKNCVVNGWGKDKFGQPGHYAVTLNKLDVDMIPHSRCSDLLKKTVLGISFNLHDNFICGGGEKGKDRCSSGGGAPLACSIGNNRYKLTGLLAWSVKCMDMAVPAVYTNMPKLRQWVDRPMTAWGFQINAYSLNYFIPAASRLKYDI